MLKKFCEKHNIFYGWVVVSCGILVMAVAYGIVCNCFSLYVKPVTEELGFTRQSFNVCVTITNVVFMLLSLFAGKIFSKIKVLTLMKISCIVLPAVLSLIFSEIMRKLGWIKAGDMLLES